MQTQAAMDTSRKREIPSQICWITHGYRKWQAGNETSSVCVCQCIHRPDAELKQFVDLLVKGYRCFSSKNAKHLLLGCENLVLFFGDHI